MKRTIRFGSIGALALSVAVFGLPAAAQADSQLSPDAVAGLVTAAESAAADQGLIPPSAQVEQLQRMQRSAPGAAQVEVTERGLIAQSSAGPVQITIPGNAPAQKVGDLSVVGNYTVQGSGSSGSSLVVLSPGQSSASWDLALPVDLTPRLDAGGAVEFVRESTESESPKITEAFRLEAPWAVDEAGTFLPTHYELTDTQLIQIVDVSEAEGIVVADPRITYGLGVYFNAWGWELNGYRNAILAAGGIAQVAVCANTNKIPNAPLRWAVSALCAVGGVNLWGVLVAIMSPPPFTAGQCYQIKVVPTGNSFVGVGSENC
ncbi:hypothetical protein P9990_25435 (plasmid) [Prescottella equi]|uniref:hypothetical protein n=1 Tax=Rhodococcus hoagii TaxID=43767 RepID=UPI00257697FC|nr:hypothetical protein [Prescottella equi]WJJ14537.1 hypothetical protein P9990_25435 [Prescottella equi]